MKNNKYAPYILGPIVLLVWGLVFYKIYQGVYGTTDHFDVPHFDALPVSRTTQKDSGYILLADYKDPFLGERFQYKNNSPSSAPIPLLRATNTHRKTSISAPQKVTTLPFPKVVYQGYQVLSTDTIALIKINGRFYPTARKGAVFQAVKVLEIYQDSIQMEFEGRPQTFLKKR
ncbi:MAG: hypothetical protein ACRBFS_22320 [Aureispira sp.]